MERLRRLLAGDTATVLRRGVLGLALLGIAGTLVELVFLRHWGSKLQLIVWPTVLLLALAASLLARRPTARTVRLVRRMAVVVVAIAALGVALHVHANFDAGPLAKGYETRWATMSVIEQLFAATTGGVGPAPTLAPGVLAEIALGLLLATVHHPALDAAPVESVGLSEALEGH